MCISKRIWCSLYRQLWTIKGPPALDCFTGVLPLERQIRLGRIHGTSHCPLSRRCVIQELIGHRQLAVMSATLARCECNLSRPFVVSVTNPLVVQLNSISCDRTYVPDCEMQLLIYTNWFPAPLINGIKFCREPNRHYRLVVPNTQLRKIEISTVSCKENSTMVLKHRFIKH